LPALGPGNDVIEGKVLAVSAILAAEAVAQEDVEAGEGRVTGRFNVGFEGYDRGEADLEGRTSHDLVVFRHNVDPVQEHRLDRILPTPDGQGIIAQRPVIGIENEGRAGLRSHNRLDVYRHLTSSFS
jgi:hypothetical protein